MGNYISTAAGFANPVLSLFNYTLGIESPWIDKPRAANDKEVRAYLLMLAARRGIAVPDHAVLSVAGIYVEGDGYIVDMPGHGAGDEVVTLEELDESGAVVRTSRIGTDKKGHIGLKAAAVVKACALPPVVKARKPRAVKAAAPVAVEVIAAPAAVEAVQAAKPDATGVDALTDRLAALEAIVARLSRPVTAGKRVRSEAERRAIVRAWEMRATMRARADLDRRALEATNGAYRGLLDQYAAVKRQMAGERIAYDTAMEQATIARDNANERAADLVQRNNILFQESIRLYERRGNTALRLVKARAAAQSVRVGLEAANSELLRLAPVAAAITALSIGIMPSAPTAAAPLRLVTAA